MLALGESLEANVAVGDQENGYEITDAEVTKALAAESKPRRGRA
jgi:hypothetical protein